MKVKKAYSYADLSRRTFKKMPLSGEWRRHLGTPQLGNSSWFIYGLSGHGKTSYLLQQAKELSTIEPIYYNTLEEGMKLSFQMACERENIKSIENKFRFQSETYDELVARMQMARPPKIVIVDSVQYLFRGLQTRHYLDLVRSNPKTTFIWLSGAEGSNPKGKIADDIRYDSDIVVHVHDFEAVIEKNRFEAYESRIIWQKGYEDRQAKLLAGQVK